MVRVHHPPQPGTSKIIHRFSVIRIRRSDKRIPVIAIQYHRHIARFLWRQIFSVAIFLNHCKIPAYFSTPKILLRCRKPDRPQLIRPSCFRTHSLRHCRVVKRLWFRKLLHFHVTNFQKELIILHFIQKKIRVLFPIPHPMTPHRILHSQKLQQIRLARSRLTHQQMYILQSSPTTQNRLRLIDSPITNRESLVAKNHLVSTIKDDFLSSIVFEIVYVCVN